MSNLIPRSVTWDVLQKTRNEAAILVLASGLSSSNPNAREMCLKHLLARPEAEARRTLLMNWEKLTAEEFEQCRARPQLFQDVAKKMLKSVSLPEKRSALTAITALSLTESLAEVLELVMDSHHALQAQANECLQAICIEWGTRARQGRDVPSIRHPMLETIYRHLQEYSRHKCEHILEAWLSLVHWDDSLQRGLISDPGNSAFRLVLRRMEESNSPSVLQLLAGYALRPTTPRSVLSILTQKQTPKLAIELTKIVGSDQFSLLLRRLRELDSLECIKAVEELTPSSFEEEKRLWLLVAASSQDFGQVLRGSLRLAKSGTAEGRQVAAEIVSQCRRPELEVVVSELQGTLAGIPKPGSFGPALMEIALWATSPSVALQQAARNCLRDFTVQRLIEQVRFWPTAMCKAMAHVVALMDSNIAGYLTTELESPSPKRRLAALQATQLLELSAAVSKNLMPLLEDSRLEIRVRAIDVLSALGSEVIDPLLPQLLNDASTDIQDAANRALRRRQREAESVGTGEGI